ncbi:MAG: bifunctional (p)ppGpp synthetase/guanosine-3',5'-bis(diphosphate) 3'-pyrophosphohydrolase [Burkholderiaceae bacterium]|nr:bifunctional (p)ppGpp synthetase/guanosine-3',5'-bis(diphosphate) 3'-pyrophosphohydrolase [Burkholderiaceae bacterium]
MVTKAALHNAQQAHFGTGLSSEDEARVMDALAYVRPLYSDLTLATGQKVLDFAYGIASILALLNCDADTRIAGLLAELPSINPKAAEDLEARFGKDVADLVNSIRQLLRLRGLTTGAQEVLRGKNAAQQAVAQVETLRKMLLAMASDMRVVMVRLASRVATLRYFAETKLQNAMIQQYARETLDLYAPLANRLGIWQLKWELEDFSFRFLEPDAYRNIAKMLEEKRIEREDFIEKVIVRLKKELAAAGIKGDVSGRPKHIFSIWNKLRGKSLDFADLHDVRAFRIIVDDIKTCYEVLGIVHSIWSPILEEFDDYISRPKANGYQSLHTIVISEEGLPLEVQIRTTEMHHFAEYGVAAHWRYKESGGSNASDEHEYDEKIAWLRQLLAWQTEVADAVAGPEGKPNELGGQLKAAGLDERIYVLTPQARVIELPSGATPIDFAYHLHSDVGHRCRGAKIDGVMVPLNTPLKNGQTVEIITAKGATVSAGPSRDWLSPGYAASARTRSKIRAWFNAIDFQETITVGRSMVEKTLQREGKTAVNLEELAHKLGFAKLEEFFHAVGKETFSLRSVELALQGEVSGKEPADEDVIVARKSRASSVEQGAKSGVLVVGTEGLMTQLAKCCKPAPPDSIIGFVTRGKGVSIHRADCRNFSEMQTRTPERVIQTAWGRSAPDTVYPVDIFVLAADRQGLLRDISEIFSREKINVIGVNTHSAKGQARMSFTAEISSTEQLQKALGIIHEVKGVLEAKRQ